MDGKNITFDTLYKNSDCFYENIIIMSKILNQFWTYDSVTDEPLNSHMDLTGDLLISKDFCNMNDYFEKIANFSKYAIKSIISNIHTKIQRDHRLLPVSQVKETDSRTMEWLAAKPGRNIREKLSGKNAILAPIRFSSCDTQENRIFKAFLSLLNNYFISWKKTELHNTDLDSLYYEVYRWLKSEDAMAIHNLSSSIPNNTLLNDKDYRKIWKAWNNIQLLDAIVKNDGEESNLQYNYGIALTCLAISELKKNGVLFYQQPLLPIKINAYDYTPLQHPIVKKSDKILYFRGNYYTENKNIETAIVEVSLNTNYLSINIKNEKIIYKINNVRQFLHEKSIIDINKELAKDIGKSLKKISTGKAVDCFDDEKDCSVVSIDCTQEQPCYSFKNEKEIISGKVNSKLITQKWIWKDNDKVQVIPAPFLKIKADNESLYNISIDDVINGNSEYSSDDYLKSANIFAKQLKHIFPKANHFIYLVPDKLDDFGDNYLAVAFNACFPDVVPVPRSIAKVFQWQKSKEFSSLNITKDSIVRVIDHSKNGLLFVTDVKAILPDENQKTLLSDNGIPLCVTWERQPTAIYRNERDIPRCSLLKKFDIDSDSELTDGSLFYFCKQQNILEIPLWKDHLLELSMMADNTDKPIILVGPDTVVKARRGKKEQIIVPQNVSISAGIKFAEFRLIIGKDDESQKKYYAYVENPNIMPFSEDTSCELELFYSYGEQKPYSLYLKTKIEGMIKRIEVRWEKKPHKDYVHIPGPNYVTELTWDEAFSKKIGKLSSLDSLDRSGRVLTCISQFGWQNLQIENWLRPKNRDESPSLYFLNKKDNNGNSVTCFRNDFPSNIDIYKGMDIMCSIIPSENFDGTLRLNRNNQITFRAFDLQINNGEPNKSELSRYIAPFLHLWNQGRTIKSPEFPSNLYAKIQNIVKKCINIIESDTIPLAIKNESLIILSALHEDADEILSKTLNEILTNTINKEKDNLNSLYHRKRLVDAIGYAIGNVTLPWQGEILNKSIILGSNLYSMVENNMAIEIIGKALWRTRNCVLALNYEEVYSLFDLSIKTIEYFCKTYLSDYSCLDTANLSSTKLKGILYEFWRQRITCLRAIELILGLYRIRNHSNSGNENILKILAPLPDNNLILRLKKLFPTLEDFCKKDQLYSRNQMLKEYKYKSIFSRIEFEINDSKWDRSIPDYLYALEKYTQGESGGIKVLGISEDSAE